MIKRNEIIERLANKGYTKKSANLIIDDVLETITEALVAGESVQFHGFGTFRVKDYASRETTDFNTGEKITVPTHKVCKFVPGEPLKRWIREGIIRE